MNHLVHPPATMPAAPPSPNTLRELAELHRLPTDKLREKWTALFASPPPGYNRVMLIKRLAHRIQEIALGGLPESAFTRMDEILQAAGYDKLGRPGKKQLAAASGPFIPIPGTILTREWNGQTYSVLVTDRGFVFQDRPYKSLSSIARAITGTQWSGPAFFGLKGRTTGGKGVETT